MWQTDDSDRAIILWFGWSSVRKWCTFDVFIFLNISQPRWMKLDMGSSNSSNLHSEYKSILVKYVLESNMERLRLITSQWRKSLTGVRGTIDNDDDAQGTTIQFACCEKGTWCRTRRKIFWSKAIDVNLSPEVRNFPLRHASFKVLKGLFLNRLPG